MIFSVLFLFLLTTFGWELPSPEDNNNRPDSSIRNGNIHNEFVQPIMEASKYQAANDVLRSLKIDEDVVTVREQYSFLPGAMSLGTGLDMLSGTQKTRILQFHPHKFHSMEEGESLHRKYRVPIAIDVEDRGGEQVQSLWKDWRNPEAYRKALAQGLGFSEFNAAMSQSQQVHHVASATKAGLITATRKTEKIGWVARVKPYLTGLSDKGDSDLRLDAGMWPSNTFVEAVCGHDIPRKDHPMTNVRLPDCILLKNDFTSSTSQEEIVLSERNTKEQEHAEEGEAKRCTIRDMRRLLQFYREFGSHVVVGVTMGGSIEEHRVMRPPGTSINGEEDETKQQQSANRVDDILNNDAHRRKQDKFSASISSSKSKHVSYQTTSPQRAGSTFTSDERSRRWKDMSNFAKRATAEKEIERADQADRVTATLPSKRRRLLLTNVRQKQRHNDAILSRSMYINGVVDAPYDVEDASLEDVSTYWSRVEEPEGQNILSLRTETLPLHNLLLEHSGVRTICTQNENGTTSIRTIDDLYASKMGRSLVRKSVLLLNFLTWIDAESAMQFHLLMRSRQMYVQYQRVIGMLSPISTEFKTTALKIDAMAKSKEKEDKDKDTNKDTNKDADDDSSTTMTLPLSAWQRLSTLSTLGENVGPLIKLLSIGAKRILLASTARKKRREYCNLMGNLAMSPIRRLLEKGEDVDLLEAQAEHTQEKIGKATEQGKGALPPSSDPRTNDVVAYASAMCISSMSRESSTAERATWLSPTAMGHAVFWTFERSMGSHRSMCVGIISNELDDGREYDIDTRMRPSKETSTAAYCKVSLV